ncbi:MAG: hypothetical protein V2J02_21510 [Pseudomonadales bacterium]|nr:hypothetical protein [Pseudomonadales bacterium]
MARSFRSGSRFTLLSLLLAVLAQPALALLAEAREGDGHERAVPAERLAGEFGGTERGEGPDGEGRGDASLAPPPCRIAIAAPACLTLRTVAPVRRVSGASRPWETFSARAPPPAS